MNTSSERIPHNQIISEHAADMEQYSASVKDLETGSCFLYFHEIRSSPKNIHHPAVELLVSGHPAQSLPIYA